MSVLFPLLLLLLSPPQRLTLDLTPTVCVAPCSIRLRVQIPPATENRWWSVTIDGPAYLSSVNPLEGEQAPYTQPFKYFYGLGQGEYVITVAVIDNRDKVVAVVSRELSVN